MATPAKSKSGTSKSDVQSVFQLCSRKGIKIVDFKFVDLPGMWQHFSIPVGELSEDIFEEGIGFDGSSIRGFQVINESDMLLFPDPSTAVVDPACSVPTLSLICDVKDPITGRRSNFSSSTASGSITISIPATSSSTPMRGSGIPARTARARTSATGPGTKKVISRFRPPTACRTSGPRSCSR
jgi:hypothetical protein